MAPGVVATNQVLTMHFGPHEVLAALSLDFDDRRSAVDVEAAVSRIEREIKAAFPEVTRVVVEAKDRNCPITDLRSPTATRSAETRSVWIRRGAPQNLITTLPVFQLIYLFSEIASAGRNCYV